LSLKAFRMTSYMIIYKVIGLHSYFSTLLVF
jgi:hypothetical protein